MVAAMRVIGFILLAVLTLAKCRGQADPVAQPAPKNTLTQQEGQQNRNMLQEDITQSRRNAITQAVSEVSPAVVGITVKQLQRVRSGSFFDDPLWDYFFPREYEREVKSLGSGFLISPEGYILTNQHVVDGATEIVVTTTGGEHYQAKIVGQDSRYDVALLKIKGEKFPYILLGDSNDTITGEWVIALGNPFGLFDISAKPTVTVGVISATGMDFRNAFQGKSYDNMIQTDASINSGNSGGPLVNSMGQCIGINAFIFTGDSYARGSIGLGFAIPINRVKEILPDLKKVGYIDRSFSTGLRVENISRMNALMLGISTNDGVLVSKVEKNSPAEKAGIEEGDVIIQIEGIRIHSTAEVRTVIDQFDIKAKRIMDVKIYRKGKLLEKSLELKPEDKDTPS